MTERQRNVTWRVWKRASTSFRNRLLLLARSQLTWPKQLL